VPSSAFVGQRHEPVNLLFIIGIKSIKFPDLLHSLLSAIQQRSIFPPATGFWTKINFGIAH
jgi:hypothetical protein